MATIPAYNSLNGVDNKTLGLDWRQERNSFFQRYFEPLRQTFIKQEKVRDILDNFIIKNYAGCDNEKVAEPLMKIKSTRRLTHLNVAQKKMFERRQDRLRKGKEQIVAEKSNSGKYSLLQVTKDGKERFFIVKKKEKTGTQFNKKNWPTIWHEKSLEFWLEITHTEEQFKKELRRVGRIINDDSSWNLVKPLFKLKLKPKIFY